jgi:hypothetical protein
LKRAKFTTLARSVPKIHFDDELALLAFWSWRAAA